MKTNFLIKVEGNIKRTINLAGPRYSPSLDKRAPNLDIEDMLLNISLLKKDDGYYNKLKELSDNINENKFIRLFFPEHFSHKRLRKITSLEKSACICLNRIIELLKSIWSYKSDIDFPVRRLNGLTKTNLKIIKEIIDLYQEISNDFIFDNENDSKKYEKENTNTYLYRTQGKLHELERFINSESAKLINNPYMIILGEAGIGKTHLLCDVASKSLTNNTVCFISLGEEFMKVTDPIGQLIKHLELKYEKKEFLSKLDKIGKQNSERCLIIFDAVNEADKKGWKNIINKLIKELEPFNNVGLILSCRTPFEKIILPKKTKLVKVYHPGLKHIEMDAQLEFFKYYKLPLPEVPLLTDEFNNPLFLNMLCKALVKIAVKKRHRYLTEITSGQKGMTHIFEFFINNVSKHIEKKLKLNKGYCWNLVKTLAKIMAEKNEVWVLRSECLIILSVKNKLNVLKRLSTEGILQESLVYNYEKNKYMSVIKFPYQKFSDHLIARYLFNKYLHKKTKKQIEECLSDNNLLGKYFFDSMASMYNIAEALILEFPIRLKKRKELMDYFNFDLIKAQNKHIHVELMYDHVLESFLAGLAWRPTSAFNKSTNIFINKLLNRYHYKNHTIDALVMFATRPKHPYNVKSLSKYLEKLSLTKRDLLWSEYLRMQYKDDIALRIISWIEKTQAKLVNEEYTNSYINLIMWFLTTTKVEIRDRATRTLYILGCKHPELLLKACLSSCKLNDPYIFERMSAAFYGVCMKLHTNEEFRKKLLLKCGRQMYNLFFSNKAKYYTTHILTRDYILRIIQLSLLYFPNFLNKNEKLRLKSPFKGIKGNRWGRTKDKNKNAYRDGNYPLGFDFENYTIGSLVKGRQNHDYNHPEFTKVIENIFWRIYKLGYSLEKFGDIDRNIASTRSYSRQDNFSKTDKYGKKYAKIAYFELAGYRKDRKLLSKYKMSKRFPDTDIDPSFPDSIMEHKLIEKDFLGNRKKNIFNWITYSKCPDMNGYLIIDKLLNSNNKWVMLYGHINQIDRKNNRAIFYNIDAIMSSRMNKNSVYDYLTNRNTSHELIGKDEDHNAFAGEIPWCDTFSEFSDNCIEINIGKKLVKHLKREILFYRNGEKIDVREVNMFWEELLKRTHNVNGLKPPEDLRIIDELLSEFSLEIKEKKYYQYKKENIYEKINIEYPTISIRGFGEFSKLYKGGSVNVPSKNILQKNKLFINTDNFSFSDSNNNVAVWSFGYKIADYDNSQVFTFIKKELIDKYLTDNELELLWTTWGERRYCSDYKHTDSKSLPKNKRYAIFRKAIRYQN